MKSADDAACGVGKFFTHSEVFTENNTVDETESKIVNAWDLPSSERQELLDYIENEARKAADKAAEIFEREHSHLSQDEFEDEILDVRFIAGAKRMLELRKRFGFPTVKYDKDREQPFIEYADGHKEYF